MSTQPVQLAVMPLAEAKQFQKQLEDLGVGILLNHQKSTCTRGCQVTVEVLGFEKDFPVIAKIYQENYAKLLDGHEINFEVLNSVYDPSKAMATCPACGFVFSTKESECPDCGLVLG